MAEDYRAKLSPMHRRKMRLPQNLKICCFHLECSPKAKCLSLIILEHPHSELRSHSSVMPRFPIDFFNSYSQHFGVRGIRNVEVMS